MTVETAPTTSAGRRRLHHGGRQPGRPAHGRHPAPRRRPGRGHERQARRSGHQGSADREDRRPRAAGADPAGASEPRRQQGDGRQPRERREGRGERAWRATRRATTAAWWPSRCSKTPKRATMRRPRRSTSPRRSSRRRWRAIEELKITLSNTTIMLAGGWLRQPAAARPRRVCGRQHGDHDRRRHQHGAARSPTSSRRASSASSRAWWPRSRWTPSRASSFRASSVASRPVFDPATRTASMEIEVPNPGFRLKPGMYARVRLTVERRQNALTVPRGAVVDTEGKRGVFMVDNAQTARFREVQTGSAGQRPHRDPRRPERRRARRHRRVAGAARWRPRPAHRAIRAAKAARAAALADRARRVKGRSRPA